MDDKRDLNNNDAQTLILSSLVDKIANIERKINGSVNKNESIPWQNYAISLIGVLFLLMTSFYWEDHTRLIAVKGVQDTVVQKLNNINENERNFTRQLEDLQNKVQAMTLEHARASNSINSIETLKNTVQTFNVQLSTLIRDFANYQNVADAKMNMYNQRLVTLTGRIDKFSHNPDNLKGEEWESGFERYERR